MMRVVEREARVFRRVWRGSVIWNFITPILFLSAMGVGLGGLVDAHQGSVSGLTYIEFVTPGLLAATAMQAASGESLWPVMLGTKWQRTFHAVVATPVRAAELQRGFVERLEEEGTGAMTAFLLVGAERGASTRVHDDFPYCRRSCWRGGQRLVRASRPGRPAGGAGLRGAGVGL